MFTKLSLRVSHIFCGSHHNFHLMALVRLPLPQLNCRQQVTFIFMIERLLSTKESHTFVNKLFGIPHVCQLMGDLIYVVYATCGRQRYKVRSWHTCNNFIQKRMGVIHRHFTRPAILLINCKRLIILSVHFGHYNNIHTFFVYATCIRYSYRMNGS